MPDPDQLYRATALVFSAILLGAGVMILIVTLANGGGPLSVGVLLGVAFAGLGGGRLYLSLGSR